MEHIIGKGLAHALAEIESPLYWPDQDDVAEHVRSWSSGAEIHQIGTSLEGRPLLAGVFDLSPHTTRTMLAWGYPHPDEPIGASGLLALGDMALAGKLQDLSGWRLVLIPCADPDQVSRQRWLRGSGSVWDWARGVWRPSRLGIEVDYGFPIYWPPFVQTRNYDGRCHTHAQCRETHGGPPCPMEEKPWRPLPESLALADAIDRWRPELVASMHSTHTSGDYTFLLQGESDHVLDDLLRIPEDLGTGRHLGEAIDRGRRWRADAPDLIRERTLKNRLSAIRKMPRYRPDALYAGPASACAFVESKSWPIQFVCPETALFRSQAFSRGELSENLLRARRGSAKIMGEKYRALWVESSDGWVLGEQIPTAGDIPTKEIEMKPHRSLLGSRALYHRQLVLAQADHLWRSLEHRGRQNHLYAEERARFPQGLYGEETLAIFRSAPEYRERATIAQEATWSWIWPLHTVSMLGNFASWLAAQDPDEEIIQARAQIDALQAAEIEQTPRELHQESDRAQGIRSQLARVIRLMQTEPRV